MAELIDEEFEGSGRLTHSSLWTATGCSSMRINGVVPETWVTASPWMHYLIGQTCFSTKDGSRGKDRTYYVHRDGETRVEVTHDEWQRQFNEARTVRR